MTTRMSALTGVTESATGTRSHGRAQQAAYEQMRRLATCPLHAQLGEPCERATVTEDGAVTCIVCFHRVSCHG